MKTQLLGRQEKVKHIKRLLLDEYVLIHLIPSFPGVDLPEHLRKLPAVTLKLSTLFRGSLEVQDDKIITELLFNGEYYRCSVPIDAIGGATNVAGDIVAWGDPTEQTTDQPKISRSSAAVAKAPKAKEEQLEKRPMLRRVK
jgi:stringent starvation protein B